MAIIIATTAVSDDLCYW